MRRFENFQALPAHAAYLGSSNPFGGMHDELDELIQCAGEPVFFVETDGRRSFFDLLPEARTPRNLSA